MATIYYSTEEKGLLKARFFKSGLSEEDAKKEINKLNIGYTPDDLEYGVGYDYVNVDYTKKEFDNKIKELEEE
jgi:hypothetical protein